MVSDCAPLSPPQCVTSCVTKNAWRRCGRFVPPWLRLWSRWVSNIRSCSKLQMSQNASLQTRDNVGPMSGVGATRVKTGGRCCVRKQNLHLFHSQLLVRTDICTSIKPSCIENTKQTSLQDVFCNIHVVVGSDWNRTETISSKMSQCGCFGSHPF